ncbi:hypothetical protein EDB85DRAFT_1895207 [Lactarius pseudohatsudake]|nr:hypothetical protein EDB85DRAFT_1895207 [Lactarius pseudohatsudake]
MSDSVADSDSKFEEEVLIFAALVFGVSVYWYSARFDKQPVHTSVLSGQQWLDELLAGHNARFYNELGMNKFVFDSSDDSSWFLRPMLGCMERGMPAASSLPPAVCRIVTVVVVVAVAAIVTAVVVVAAVVAAAAAVDAAVAAIVVVVTVVAVVVAMSPPFCSELQRHLAMTPAAGPGVMGAAAVAFETCVAMSWWLVVRLGLAKLTLPGDAGFALLTPSCTRYQPPPPPYHRQQQDGVDDNDIDNDDNDNFDKAAATRRVGWPPTTTANIDTYAASENTQKNKISIHIQQAVRQPSRESPRTVKARITGDRQAPLTNPHPEPDLRASGSNAVTSPPLDRKSQRRRRQGLAIDNGKKTSTTATTPTMTPTPTPTTTTGVTRRRRRRDTKTTGHDDSDGGRDGEPCNRHSDQ